MTTLHTTLGPITLTRTGPKLVRAVFTEPVRINDILYVGVWCNILTPADPSAAVFGRRAINPRTRTDGTPDERFSLTRTAQRKVRRAVMEAVRLHGLPD